MSHDASTVAPDEMTLRDYTSILRRRQWVVVLPAILVAVVAFLVSLAATDQYRSRTQVLVKEPPSASAIGAPERPMQQRVLQNELQRAQGSAMRDEVRAIIGSEPRISVRLAASEDVDVFVFTAESSVAELAATAADVYASVYIESRREALTVDLEAQAEVLREQLTLLDAETPTTDDKRIALDLQRDSFEVQLSQVETSIDLARQSGASVIDAAQVASTPFEPTPRRNAALGLVVGLLLGVLAALLIDYFDNSLRDEIDLVDATGLTVLGIIPRLRDWKPGSTRVVTLEQPSSAPAEAYRAFRTAVNFVAFERDIKVVQVTSAKPGDGKTTTSVNLAVASARAGQKVLLLDCDLRRPRVHAFFDLPNTLGFTTVMVGGDLSEVAQTVEGEPNLTVVGSGTILPDPSELLAGSIAKRFIASARERFDLVVIDSPPVLAVADPLVLSAAVDGVILVASAMQSDRRDVARAHQQLAQLDTPMIGALLNSFDINSSDEYRHSYGVYTSAEA